LTGIALRGMDVNIFVQIGFVVLVGLACKNAILIVEFAMQQRDEGKSREAAVYAAVTRLRPILMTSACFIHMFPPYFAAGAGAEMRRGAEHDSISLLLCPQTGCRIVSSHWAFRIFARKPWR
jgi:multidrug efflux pump